MEFQGLFDNSLTPLGIYCKELEAKFMHLLRSMEFQWSIRELQSRLKAKGGTASRISVWVLIAYVQDIE